MTWSLSSGWMSLKQVVFTQLNMNCSFRRNTLYLLTFSTPVFITSVWQNLCRVHLKFWQRNENLWTMSRPLMNLGCSLMAEPKHFAAQVALIIKKIAEIITITPPPLHYEQALSYCCLLTALIGNRSWRVSSLHQHSNLSVYVAATGWGEVTAFFFDSIWPRVMQPNWVQIEYEQPISAIIGGLHCVLWGHRLDKSLQSSDINT